MCTSTVEPSLAVPEQPEIVIGLLTVELSLIAKSVPLVAAGQAPLDGGSGGGSVPLYRSTGFCVLGLVTLLGVALATRASRTCCGVAVGWSARYRAAAPATCGVAIDVPLIVFVPPLSQSDVMFTPGAKMSVQVPKFENEARASLVAVALTVIASGTRAGEKPQASAFELPDAIA